MSRPVDPSALRNWVGGSPVSVGSAATMDVRDPTSNQVLTTVPSADEAAVEAAVDAAERGASEWGALPPVARCELLLKLADAVTARLEPFAVLESLDVGKPMAQARYEIGRAATTLRYFAGAGRVMQGTAAGEYRPNVTSMLRREPIGIVAALAPWNYPMVLTAWKLGPALAAGNSVILKPSPNSPMTAMLMGELAAEILPPGTLNVITGGPDTGRALILHPKVGMVSLTGGTTTGMAVMELAAKGLKRVHLELGGKAPVIVFEDADLERLGKAVIGAAYGNGGQDCTAAARVIVDSKRHDEVLEVLQGAAAEIRPMHPRENPDAEMGPLVSVEHRDRVKGFVDRAVSNGADLLTGGDAEPSEGAYYLPTLLAAESGDEVAREEIFGPVLTAFDHHGERDAIELANGSRYGLAASVWTQDIDRAIRVANQIQAGTVWINDHGPTVTEMPFGGFKQSGIGRDLSVHAIEEHTEMKHVAISYRDQSQ